MGAKALDWGLRLVINRRSRLPTAVASRRLRLRMRQHRNQGAAVAFRVLQDARSD
jgi:hypothetical protein